MEINQPFTLTVPLEVSEGGTGVTSFVPYAIIVGGTTATGPLQQVSGLGTSGFVLTSNGAGTLPSWQANGNGSVSTVSVVTANGLAGTVANPTTTPAITLSTTITGILQGNGTAISAATTGNLTDAGTDGITIGSGTGAVLGSGTTISQHVSDSTHNGYLSSTDWSTFNGKQSALSFADLSGTANQVVLSASGTGVLVGSTNITLSLPQSIAIASTPTFGGLTLNGTLSILEGGLTPTKYTIFQGGDQTVDITYTLPTALPASIAFLKVSSLGVMTFDTNVYLTSSTGVTSVSGTANRITSSGGTTPVIDISASYVGQSSITTLGTIGTGTWNGNLIIGTYGGTGVNNSTKTFTYLKNISFTAADDTGVYTLPTGTKTLLATDGSIGALTGTILSSVLGNSALFVGTTSIALNRASASQALTGITSIDGSAATLTTARTLWGQSFDGSANVTGSLTSVGDITGGASSMTITAGTGNNRSIAFRTTGAFGANNTNFTLNSDGTSTFTSDLLGTGAWNIIGGTGSMIITGGTGNSRQLILKSTTSGGVATTFLTGNADQSTTFGGNISGTGAWGITGGAGNMTITSGTGNSRTMLLKTTTSGGVATTALTLNADQTATFASSISLGSALTVANGGTGLATLTAHAVLLGEGTSNVAFATPSTAGYFLMSNGASADPSFNLAYNYIKVSDQKTQNTDGGTFTSGAWRTRTINTEDTDTGNNCSIASNQITLDAGTYECYIKCPGYGTIVRHQARLQNITDTATTLTGTSEIANSAAVQTSSIIIGRFTLAAQKTLEVQHQCQTTGTTTGFGIASNFTTEFYTVAEFRKVL